MRPPLTLKSLASRGNSVLLGVTAALGAAFLAWIVYASDYIVYVAKGPEAITSADLAKLGPDAHGRWFNVTSGVKSAHILQTTTTTRRRRGGTSTSITNHFGLLGQEVMVVETSWTSMPENFLAWASAFDQDGEYYKRTRTQLDKVSPADKIPISPLLLTTSVGVSESQYMLFGAMGLAALALIYMAIRALRRLRNYMLSGPIARLKKSTRASEGIPALVADIDRELAGLDPTARRTGPILLPSWFMNVSRNSFSMISARDVVYIAPYTMTKKAFSIITTSKGEIVRVADRTGQAIELSVNPGQMQGLLEHLYYWAPWAAVGNEANMERRFGKTKARGGLKGWFKTWPSKAELLQAVDSRRTEIDRLRAEHAAKMATDSATQPRPA